MFYSEDGAGEDEEDEHSVWTWLKSVVSLVDGPMADWAEEPARGTGARGAQGRREQCTGEVCVGTWG